MMQQTAIVWRAANRLLDTHGIDALLVAAQRANVSRDRGNIVAHETWLRVADAVSEWERPRRPDDVLI
jgi:hypothetical protein